MLAISPIWFQIATGTLGSAYLSSTLLASWRKGRTKSDAEAITTAREETAIYRDRVERLEEDLKKMRDTHAQDMANLNTKLSTLSIENDTLKELIRSGGLHAGEQLVNDIREAVGQGVARVLERLDKGQA